jgi:hypothetical protein
MQTRELLIRAKNAIQQGEKSLRAAAEDIATAQAQGATQREIAQAVGKSLGWVNGLLQWRVEGYKDGTPFGPTSRAARQRRLVQSTEQPTGRTDAASPPERMRSREALTAITRAEDKKQSADRNRRGDRKTPARRSCAFDRNGRDRLIQALYMLGSISSGERASAAQQVETLRSEFGLTWQQLIIPATSDSVALAA